MGTGNTGFDFEPVLWTDASALPGNYSVEFKLVDQAGVLPESGVFRFNTQVVPEPSAFLAVLSGAGMLLARRRRQIAA